MTAPVLDLSTMREMIDHDPALEKELIQNFRECYAAAMAELIDAASHSDSKGWHHAAHTLKGLAYNIGAQYLGDLCASAQQITIIPQSCAETVQAIHHAYADVDALLSEEIK